MNNKIFLLCGHSGSDSDRMDWCVAVYHDESKAKTHARLAQEFADAFKKLDFSEQVR